MAVKKRRFVKFDEGDLEFYEPPVTILNEVIEELTEMFEEYSDDISFNLNSFKSEWDGRVGYSITVTSEKIANYEKEIVQIKHHPIDFYPIRIQGSEYIEDVEDEPEFIDILSKIINHDDTKELLARITSYSRE